MSNNKSLPVKARKKKDYFGKSQFRIFTGDKVVGVLERQARKIVFSISDEKVGLKFAVLKKYLEEIGYDLFPVGKPREGKHEFQ